MKDNKGYPKLSNIKKIPSTIIEKCRQKFQCIEYFEIN